MRVALLGGGRMGEALARGWCASGYEPADLVVAEVDPERRRELVAVLDGVRVVPSPAWAVADAGTVVVAVKPGDVAAVLEAAASSLAADALVISIAAGVTLAALEASAPGRPIVRAMPNTPAVVGRGAAAIAGNAAATDADLDRAQALLESVGTVVQVPERLLDAVTGLSGSGPAYVFLVAEAMIDAGVLVGLPRPAARELVVQTLLGAATLLAESGESPESLRAGVTSPGGTTAAGLMVLEDRGLRAALMEAVAAAAARSAELGGGV
ncbi:MAG TPA: pyrroline-5-carboxylate reductase [Acidimicrobiia bacterium]|nr:pyrroline-5-carboxylate reductase [Acidimicrobiia bacterium]